MYLDMWKVVLTYRMWLLVFKTVCTFYIQMHIFPFKVVTYFGDVALLKTIWNSSFVIFCGIVFVNICIFAKMQILNTEGSVFNCELTFWKWISPKVATLKRMTLIRKCLMFLKTILFGNVYMCSDCTQFCLEFLINETTQIP